MSEILYYGRVPGEGDRIQVVTVEAYPDGMPRVGFPRGVHVERVLLRPRSMSSFIAGLFWIDALIDRGQPAPELILPFVPGARQDRLNPTGDFLFTAKSIAAMINALGWPGDGGRPMKLRPKKKPKARTITRLTMSSGRVVTDPVEINRLLRAEGFTVDAETGRVGLGEGLKRPQ